MDQGQASSSGEPPPRKGNTQETRASKGDSSDAYPRRAEQHKPGGKPETSDRNDEGSDCESDDFYSVCQVIKHNSMQRTEGDHYKSDNRESEEHPRRAESPKTESGKPKQIKTNRKAPTTWSAKHSSVDGDSDAFSVLVETRKRMKRQDMEWRTLRETDITLSKKADTSHVGEESEEHKVREAKRLKAINTQNASFHPLDREQAKLEKGSVPF